MVTALSTLLVLLGLLFLAAAIGAFFVKPEKRHMAAWKTAGFSLCLSLGCCAVGGALAPHDAKQGKPRPTPAPAPRGPTEVVADQKAVRSLPPAQEVKPPSKPAEPEISMTANQLLSEINELWAKADGDGAFRAKAASSGRIEAGANRGGSVTTSCVSQSHCLMITAAADGNVLSAIMMSGKESATPDDAVDAYRAALALLRAVAPAEPEISDMFTAQLDRALDGKKNARAKLSPNTCLEVSDTEIAGIWTQVTPAPCESD